MIKGIYQTNVVLDKKKEITGKAVNLGDRKGMKISYTFFSL